MAQKRHRVGGHAFLPAGRPQPFVGRGLDADPIGGDGEAFRQIRPHLRNVGAEFGPLRHHNQIHVDHLPAPLPHQDHHLLQQPQAVRVLPAGISRREVLADVPQAQGPQQGVHQGVGQHVRIAVAVQPQAVGVGQGDTGQNQGTSGHQTVNVVALADAQIHGRACRKGSSLPLARLLRLPAGIQIRPPLARAALPLLLAPAGDGVVVSAPQHRRHLHLAKNGGPRVMGVLQQPPLMAFRLQGSGSAHCSRQQAHDPIDHRHGGQFPTCEHKVPQGDLFIRQAANPFIKSFVMAAEDHQLVDAPGPALQIALMQGFALGGHQQAAPLPLERNGFKGGEDRLGLEHHPRTTPVGFIIDLAVTIPGVVPWIVKMKVRNATAQSPADDAKLPQATKGVRHQADHIDPHGFAQAGARRSASSGRRTRLISELKLALPGRPSRDCSRVQRRRRLGLLNQRRSFSTLPSRSTSSSRLPSAPSSQRPH